MDQSAVTQKIGRIRFACVDRPQKARKMAAAAFLRNLIAAMPYRRHIVLPPPARASFENILSGNGEWHVYPFFTPSKTSLTAPAASIRTVIG